MFFNIWDNINYVNKIIIIALLILISFYIITKILLETKLKIKKNLEEQEKIRKLIEKIEKLGDIEKFELIKKQLSLNTSYKIAKFVNLPQKDIINIIKENNISAINNLIVNKLKGKKKII